MTPDWDGFAAVFAPNSDEFLPELRHWCEAVHQVLERMLQLHLSLDLEDETKSI